MRTYKVGNSYYSCNCGGTFSVDFSRDSHGVYPATYRYICRDCGQYKYMPCLEEMRMCAKYVAENPIIEKGDNEYGLR